MTTRARGGLIVAIWAMAAAICTPAEANDAAAASAAQKVVVGLESAEAGERAKAFVDLEALLARDPAAGALALPALKEILHTRGGAERARAERLLLKIPGDEAVALWWTALDPAREDDDRVLAAGIEAAEDRAKDAVFARRLVDHARERQATSSRRALAIEALGALEDPAARLLLRTPLPGADWVEESCRALALSRRGGAESFPPLLDLVAHEHASVRVAAWESLVRLSGRNFPPRREPWETWWKEHAGDWRHEPARADGASAGARYAAPEPSHVPTYYGFKLHGASETYHTVFCLDISASMARTGLVAARRELSQAIEGLTTRHFFDVIAFNEQVMPWAGRQVRAHPVFKAKALAWIAALEPKSYTNIYDAVERAFEEMGRGRHPSAEPTRLDTVFLLSDGAPNRGRWHEADQVIRGISDLSLKQVPVHTVGVGEAVRPLLKSIADATGGSFYEVFD